MDVADQNLLVYRDIGLEKNVKLVVHDVVVVVLGAHSELKRDSALHVAVLLLAKFDLRLPELDLQLKLRLVAILRSELGVGLFEQLGINGELVRVEALDHELRVDLVLEPVVALHGLEQAVRDAVTQHKLHVLVFEVVLEEVIVLIWLLQAVMVVRADVEEERQVEFVVVDLWVSCEPPVDVEVARFVELGDGHRQHVDLIVQCLFRQIVQILVDDARAKQVVSVLQDVLA